MSIVVLVDQVLTAGGHVVLRGQEKLAVQISVKSPM
ncbi:unannotated protein [freshwater metagenome]|uniref:Unannotated protein n=1 Tax=freshwater metagenome TaxID=449393 RepID=A0A6J7PX96_9ZZZZ